MLFNIKHFLPHSNNIYLLLILILSFFITSCDPPNKVNTGKLFNEIESNNYFPSIPLKNINGEIRDLKKNTQNGKITLVSFWATWCGPCNLEFNALAPYYKKWQEKYNFNIMAISIDDAKMYPHLVEYVDAKKWPFDFYYDEELKVKNQLKINQIPMSYLLDQEGKVVHIDYAYHEAFPIELEAMLKKLNK